MKNKPILTFWVSNISNRNVSLSDLNLTIKAHCSVNLLDSRHYNFTLEQLINSASKGSIFKKRNIIFVRKVPPYVQKNSIQIDPNAIIPDRNRSLYKHKEEKYEELSITDEQFAEEDANLNES